jgi:hypothetical protein
VRTPEKEKRLSRIRLVRSKRAGTQLAVWLSVNQSSRTGGLTLSVVELVVKAVRARLEAQ